MTDVNLITTAEFQAYAPEIDISQYTEPTLSGMISQASGMVSDFLDFTPVLEVITDESKRGMVTTDGDLLIFPNKIPVQSVASIGIYKGTTTVQVVLQDGAGNNRYNIDYTKRNVRVPWGEVAITGNPVFNNFFQLRGIEFYTKMTYTGGWAFSELPKAIKQATILYMRDIISRKYNPQGASRITQGAITLEFAQRKNGETSDLVADAEKLLASYRKIG